MSVKKFYNQLECFRGYAALCVAAVHFNVNSIFHHSPFAVPMRLGSDAPIICSF